MSEWKPPPENLRTIEHLRELHSQVKAHPYRLTGQEIYLKSYKEVLWRMTDIWYFVIRETKFREAKNMTHDLNGAIGNIGRENYKYSADNDAHVENCISVVHEFLDEGIVSKYYEFIPNEDALLRVDGPFLIHMWNENLGGFYIRVPRNKISQFEGRVRTWMAGIVGTRKDEESNKKFIEGWEEILYNVKKYNK